MPYVLIGGMSFFDRKEVRDILAYLKVIDNPHDEPSLMRIINQPARGIGNAAQKRLVEEATSRGKFLWDVLPDALVIDGVDAKTAAAVAQFRRLIEEFRDQPAKKVTVAQIVAPSARQNRLPRFARQAVSRSDRARIALGVARRNRQRGGQLRQEPPRQVGRTQPVRLSRRHAAQRARRQRRKRIAARPQRRRADDAAQREGPGVSARVSGRHGRRHFAAQAFGGGGKRFGHRRRAAAVLRRRHAGPRTPDALLRPHAPQMGQAAEDHSQPVPLRNDRPGRKLPAGGRSEEDEAKAGRDAASTPRNTARR